MRGRFGSADGSLGCCSGMDLRLFFAPWIRGRFGSADGSRGCCSGMGLRLSFASWMRGRFGSPAGLPGCCPEMGAGLVWGCWGALSGFSLPFACCSASGETALFLGRGTASPSSRASGLFISCSVSWLSAAASALRFAVAARPFSVFDIANASGFCITSLALRQPLSFWKSSASFTKLSRARWCLRRMEYHPFFM